MTNQERVEIAKTYINDGNLREAKAQLEAILAVDPKVWEAQFELARVWQMQGNDQQAEIGYRRVLELVPTLHHADMELARIYFRQRRLELSLAHYRKVIGRAPDHVDAYRELGKLCENMGEPDKAVESLAIAAKYCPEDDGILFEWARTLREAGREQEAAQVFQRLLALPVVRESRFYHNKVLNELEITQRKEVLESKLRAMIAMIIDRCNIHCRICHIWKGDWQVRDSVMQELVDLFPYMEDICWEGGEVFLMKGFEDILAEGAKYPHFKQNIFSNGLLINEKVLSKIAKGRADIVFSIDGANKDTYEYIRDGAKFERLEKALELVREFRRSNESNINIYLNPVIMRRNHDQLEEFVEFAKKYDFTALTFAPIRGEFGQENIFELQDEAALATIRKSLPRVIAKAREYGIRLNNWLPVPCEEEARQDKPVDGGQAVPADLQSAPAEPAPAPAPQADAPLMPLGVPRAKPMICYAPWQRLTIDSGGAARPFAFCLNKFVGDTNRQSLAQIWNCEGMQWYRRKIANNDFNDICQPECISGQVRDKICRIE